MNKYELEIKQKEELLKQLKEGKTIILEGYFTDLESTWHKEVWTYSNNSYTCLCTEVYNENDEEDEDFSIEEDLIRSLEDYFYSNGTVTNYTVKEI